VVLVIDGGKDDEICSIAAFLCRSKGLARVMPEELIGSWWSVGGVTFNLP
jgi:hypothetical protein